MRTPLVLIAACLVTSIVRSVSVFRALPARMFSHFGPDGHPDGVMTRADFFMVYSVCCLGTLSLLLVIPVIAHMAPSRVMNVPNREYWLAPERPERRQQLQDKLTLFSRWFAAALAVLFTGLLELVLRANLTNGVTQPSQMHVLVAGFLCAVIGLSLILFRMFRVPS
ncbi:MAG: hypothetical protein RL701_3754 [Pseudomonadota bacterium]|jgi:serine/threonine-protein kinase